MPLRRSALASCAETLGSVAFCPLLGVVWQKYSVVSGASDLDLKREAVRELEQQVGSARRKLEKLDVKRQLASTIENFNALCAAVRG